MAQTLRTKAYRKPQLKWWFLALALSVLGATGALVNQTILESGASNRTNKKTDSGFVTQNNTNSQNSQS